MKFVFPVAFLLATIARADWPTYLHDNSRVGQTGETITAPLTKRWECNSPTAPQMAWAGEDGRVIEGLTLENRIRFDDVFHTAIVGGRVFFGSSVDGRVYCRNLTTGKEEWAVFTDAPIRLAPQIVGGKLYIGSDDGYAYCLEAATGKLVWKLRAGPNDERILARGRMISRWPIRTGILVDDGIAYFGAGVFPHENVYLYAVEGATGKVIWKNDSISQEDAGRNDLSPQGYMLATKDILFVPSGRALSVAFDRKTGQQINKPAPGWRGDAGGQIGGTQAMLLDDQILAVGEHQVLALDQKTGKTGYAWFRGTQMTFGGDVGYMATGKEIIAIDRNAHAEGTRVRHAAEMVSSKLTAELKKHPALAALKKVEAADKALKAARNANAQEAEMLKAQTAFDEAAKVYEPQRIDYQTKKDKLAEAKQQIADHKDIGVKWKWESPHESALILVGKTLVVGGKDEVVCLDAETGKPLWQSPVEGDARGLAVSAGHLVVSTTAGKIYAFGDSTSNADTPVREALAGNADKSVRVTADPFPKDELSDMYATAAESILAQTKIRDGYCLVIGSEKGRLAYEIAKRSDLAVYCLESDESKVRASREALVRTGLYGSRINVDHLDLSVIPYSSYFANLIVSDHLLLTGEMPGIAKEVARNLKPIGGTICLGVPDNASDAVKAAAMKNIPAWLAATKLTEEKATLATAGNWSRLTRAALPGADSWSHQYGNAANTSSNHDERVKGGLNVLWYGDPGPSKMVNRHAGAVGPLSVNGRLFMQGETTVMAYDAFNGRQLWEVENPGALRDGLKGAREPGNIGVRRIREHILEIADADDDAAMHNRDSAAHAPNFAEVGGHDKRRECALLLQRHDRVENRASHHDVDAGCGVVRDEYGRFEHERPRNRYALALALAEFVWVLVHRAERQPHGIDERGDGLASFVLIEVSVAREDRLRDVLADRQSRLEKVPRLLTQVSDTDSKAVTFAAGNAAHRGSQNTQRASTDNGRIGVRKVCLERNGASERRLARARVSHNRENLTRRYVEAQPIHRDRSRLRIVRRVAQRQVVSTDGGTAKLSIAHVVRIPVRLELGRGPKFTCGGFVRCVKRTELIAPNRLSRRVGHRQ